MHFRNDPCYFIQPHYNLCHTFLMKEEAINPSAYGTHTLAQPTNMKFFFKKNSNNSSVYQG